MADRSGADAFTGRPGQLRLDGDTLLGDVNGDGVADIAIRLKGVTSLAASAIRR